MFKPLNLDQIKEIVRIQLHQIEKLLDEYKLKMNVSEEAVEWIAERGYDPQLGARPVKRLIQKDIVNELSKEIIAGKIAREDNIIVDTDGDRLIFSREKVHETVS
jgi:ATP-dependent Clp protease ATP-binding subunit ClpB